MVIDSQDKIYPNKQTIVETNLSVTMLLVLQLSTYLLPVHQKHFGGGQRDFLLLQYVHRPFWVIFIHEAISILLYLHIICII